MKRNVRVLVVEDDMITMLMLSGLLEEWGYTVSTACNGLECMSVQRQAPFDVVITDIIMPEQDGFTTISQLKEEFPGVRVIAISGGAPSLDMEGAIRMAEVLGADAIFPKPVNTKRLEEVLQSYAHSITVNT